MKVLETKSKKSIRSRNRKSSLSRNRRFRIRKDFLPWDDESIRPWENKIIRSWDCSRCSEAHLIPISLDHCPYCCAPMPQQVRTKIYRQVAHEFRVERRDRNIAIFRNVMKRLFRFIKFILPYLLGLLALFVLISGAGWLIKQLFSLLGVVGDFIADIFSDVSEFFRGIIPEKAEEITATVPEIPKEKDPFTLQKLWEGVKTFFGTLFGWIVGLFRWIIQLPKKLGNVLAWLWDAVVWLWNAIVWLVKLIIGLAFLCFYLAFQLIKLLFKVIKFILSLI